MNRGCWCVDMAEVVLYNVGQIARCWAFTLERRMEMSKQWEYKVLTLEGHSKDYVQWAMDNCGNEGWELVSVSDCIAYMKREKKAAEPQEPAFPVINDPWAVQAVERTLSKMVAQAEVMQ
jgi:hypothetical protein